MIDLEEGPEKEKPSGVRGSPGRRKFSKAPALVEEPSHMTTDCVRSLRGGGLDSK